MAQATDLPIELIDLIFSFLPPNHAEQVQWRRAAATIGREPRPDGWRLEDLLERPWMLQRWNNPDFRRWEPVRFFTMCPCGEVMATYFGRDCHSRPNIAQLQNNPQPGPPGPPGPAGDDGETPIVQVVPPQIDVARPKIFSGDGKELSGFITACKIYLSLKMVGRLQGDQITWILSYVQGGAAESWKENIMEMIEGGEEEAPAHTEELFDSLRNNFGDADEESTAVGKLRLIEQGSKSAEEHVQEFKRIARDSGYEGRALIEEFKRSLSGRIRKALMESENPPTTIRSWYERSMKLDRQWRQAKAEEDYYRRGQAKPQLRTHTSNNTFVRPQPQRRDPNAMDVDTAAGPSREAYEEEQAEIRDEEERYERVNKAVGRFTTPKNIIEGIALGVEAAFARELARNRRANGRAEGLAQQPKEKAEGWAQSPGDVADRLNGEKAERLEEDNSKTATAGQAEAGQNKWYQDGFTNSLKYSNKKNRRECLLGNPGIMLSN
ncbi:hypothetical protein AGABI2DRAFT_144648 [Agaricus bisporus var. bisporus H97]|uniref:hypothetical protein n=1 Tax=Agaricus bisporus var. bisporus (strain H97 / ATCC MYA-4626 / FGSC 10389) TaxID=936046 RepID=UPI00029F5223|nr:hypothetical protein AGABI2DRAFT_144648 [Agaricus bisporus var. bisporus H97]EKV45167.1 hypothetical protein AGABI2DRAFT_144648 [Agaricus bisporus var. bisporus H97]